MENQQERNDKLPKETELEQTEIIDNKSKVSLRVWSETIEVQETKIIKRLTFRSLFADLADVLNLDKGLLYTLQGLTLRPAQTIREYLDDGRHKVTNPIKYFILIVGTTLLIASLNGYFDNTEQLKKGFEFGYMSQDGGDEVPKEVKDLEEKIEYFYTNYFVKYQNIWFLFTIVFTSLFTYLFFRKIGYNFIEHNVINAYVFVHTYLFFTIIVVFQLHDGIWSILYTTLYLVMTVIVFKHLFQLSWWKAFWKSMLAYLASVSILMLFFMIFGIVWAIRTKMEFG